LLRFHELHPDVPLPIASRPDTIEILTEEIWVEAELNDGWIAAYRLLPQEGVPVIGELRIFPKSPRNARQPGLWDGALLGSDVTVPKGGLTARLLRRARVGAHHRFGNKAVALFPESEISRVAPASLPRVQQGRSARVSGKGGRPKLPDLVYARVAAAYERACMRGDDSPVRTAATAARLPLVRVRTMLHVARIRGLLTTRGQGLVGGVLTPKARAVLGRARPRGRGYDRETGGRK